MMKNQKRIKTILILIAIMMFCMIGMKNKVFAQSVSAGNELVLGLEQYRKSGNSYKAGDKIVWKIASYPGGTVNRDRALYCIK